MCESSYQTFRQCARNKSHRTVWGIVSGGFLLVSLVVAVIAIWKGLVFGIDNMPLAEAAAEIQTQNAWQMWAVGLLTAGIAFYAIASLTEAKRSDEEPEG